MSKVDSHKLEKPALIMIVGMPGSGKTYLMRRLAEDLGAVHISAEKIRHEIFEKPSLTRDEEAVVRQLMMMLAEEFLKTGLSVLYDTSVSTKDERKEMRDFARKLKAEPILIWQQLDTSTAFIRTQKRNPQDNDDDRFAVPLSKDLFMGLSRQIQTPGEEEAIVISGKHSYKGQLQTVVRKLIEMRLIPQNDQLAKSVPKPGLVNLVSQTARLDDTKRNIHIE
ncbi:MAG: ATP-binding protein [Patescibacteria group bacterium]